MTDTNAADPERYIVPGLRRGLLLLRSFSRERPAMGLSELAREHGLNRSTVLRLVRTLESMGFLERIPGAAKYRLGASVLGPGFEFLASLELPEIARSVLEALRDETGTSAHLGIRDGAEVVYIGRYPCRSAIASTIRLGSRLDAHATTMGRVLLADLTDAELTALYGGRDLAPHTDQTPTSLEALRPLLADDRARGYVVSRSFFERGVASAAAPVRNAAGRVAAAINVTAPEQTLTAEALEGEVAARVCAAATEISARLGHNGGTRAAAE